MTQDELKCGDNCCADNGSCSLETLGSGDADPWVDEDDVSLTVIGSCTARTAASAKAKASDS